MDVVGPLRVFGGAGDVRPFVGGPDVAITLVAEERRTIVLSHGARMEADEDYETCPALDVLVVPGGSSRTPEIGRRAQQRNPATIAFIVQAPRSASLVCSVCTGTFLLAEAGLLAGKRASTNWQFRDELQTLMRQRGEDFELVKERVVWDGALVTAGGVTSGIDLALSILESMSGEDVRRAVERSLELVTPTA